MPVIKSAIKKLRRDKKMEKAHDAFMLSMDKALKDATKKPTEKTVAVAFSITDKAVKKHLIHKNKAARIKSKLSSFLPKKTATKGVKAPAVKTEAAKPKTVKKTSK